MDMMTYYEASMNGEYDIIHYRTYGGSFDPFTPITNMDPAVSADPVAVQFAAFLPEGITLFSQGEYVAASLTDYLRRHPEMDIRLTKQGNCRFLTTESAAKFSDAASVFLNHPVEVEQIRLVE